MLGLSRHCCHTDSFASANDIDNTRLSHIGIAYHADYEPLKLLLFIVFLFVLVLFFS